MSILKEHFEIFNKKYFIRCSEYRGDELRFTYHTGMKNWSHWVSIKVIENEVYFQTCRTDPYEDLLPYQYTNYSAHQIGCRIPINETELIHKYMTEYGNFKCNY